MLWRHLAALVWARVMELEALANAYTEPSSKRHPRVGAPRAMLLSHLQNK